MPYEDDYKMWLEKMLIKMNPDWICDGMHDTEFTHDWCYKYCGKDDLYITPKCLHMFYHHIARADSKTENSSEKPNNCEEWQDWKDRMWAEAVVTETTTEDCSTVDKDINVRSKDEPQPCEWCKFYDGENCFSQEPCKAKTEPQTERSE